MFSETFISIVRRQPWRIRANWGERRLYMKKTAAPHGYFNRIYASGKWHRSPCDPNTYFSAMWNIQRQRTHRVASILLCFLHITPSTNTAVALVVNQEVIVYLPGEAAIHPQLSTWCLDPKSPPPNTHKLENMSEGKFLIVYIAGITATVLKFLKYSSNVQKESHYGELSFYPV